MQHAFMLLLVAMLVDYGIALSLYPIFSRYKSLITAAVWIAVSALMLSPLIIPREHIPLRAVVALISVDLVFRIVDFARQSQSGLTLVDWPTYCRFLRPFPFLLVVFNLRSKRLSNNRASGPNLLRILLGGTILVIALCVTVVIGTNPLLQSSFLLDHTIKVGLLLIGIESLSVFLFGLERMAKFDSVPFVDRVFMARTPAEFWFRYNQRVRLWLMLNVFLPSGGRRAPMRGIIFTFAFSALLHEVAFGITTSRFDGYQATFFLLQAPAVILSRPLERMALRGGRIGKAFAHGLTILWLSVTSILFCHGMNRVMPFFYASSPILP